LRRALVVDAKDNVATLLEAAEAGDKVVAAGSSLTARERIPEGHKVALVNLEPGEAVFKYGEVIGRTTRPVPAGSWVHEHNLHSAVGGADRSERDTERE